MTQTVFSPLAIIGSQAFFCGSLAASMMMRAHNTADENSGPGTGPQPSSSNSTATSVMQLPVPPYCSGMAMPVQPSSDI